MTQTTYGVSTGGKLVNLAQLEAELGTAGVAVDGLGMHDEMIYPYDAEGAPVDFAEGDEPAVDATIAAHVAMRDKNDTEYAAEFQNPATTPERKQDIRDITAGLLPREQVPMTEDDLPKWPTI